MKHDALSQALKNRKGMGVDITLIIGDKKDDKNKSDELAPEVKDAGDNGPKDQLNDQDKLMMDANQDQSLMGPPSMKPQGGNPDEASDRALIEKMLADHENAEKDSEAPTSLMGKARKLMRDKLKS